MPEWLAVILEYFGPFAAFCIVLLALLVYDRRNNKNRPANGNDFKRLEGAYRESREAFQDSTSALRETCGKLNAIHEDMRENNAKLGQASNLLNRILGRLEGRKEE